MGGGHTVQANYPVGSLVLWSTSGYLETWNSLSAVSVTLNKWRQLFFFCLSIEKNEDYNFSVGLLCL